MTAASPVSSAAPKVQTPLRRFVAEFLGSRVAVFGLVLLVLVVSSALLAPWIAPQDPYDLSKLDIMSGMLPPGSADPDGNVFWLGSDEQGRDLLSAILYGLRTSLMVGFSSTAIALAIGLVVGMIAAYAGGSTDAAIMRLVDIQLSFPAILIALILLAVLGKGVDKVIIALTAVQWAYYARTVRSP
jgi:peptide/nickel transport system permease protein